MAIAVFILLKAGQLTITTGSDDSAELDPFVISFIAIISGLLSEQAYGRIQRAGATIFRPRDTGTQRWAHGLGAGMQVAQVTNADLAGFVGVSPDTVQAWAAEQESVSEQHQALVAAALRTAPREIFTDLPPGAVSPGPENKNTEG